MAGGGNQALQPYLQNGLYEYKISGELKNTNLIHFCSLYVGNHPDLTKEQITQLAYKLNHV